MNSTLHPGAALAMQKRLHPADDVTDSSPPPASVTSALMALGSAMFASDVPADRVIARKYVNDALANNRRLWQGRDSVAAAAFLTQVGVICGLWHHIHVYVFAYVYVYTYYTLYNYSCASQTRVRACTVSISIRCP